jgi:hypothetical protein
MEIRPEPMRASSPWRQLRSGERLQVAAVLSLRPVRQQDEVSVP